MILYTDSIPGYTGSNLKTYFEAALGIPVAVDNDANCMAMGEYAYGAAKGHPDFLSLVYGTGIGGALVQNLLDLLRFPLLRRGVWPHGHPFWRSGLQMRQAGML